MKHLFFKGCLCMLLAIASFACKDKYDYSELVRDNRPAIPVTYPGTTTYGFNPFIQTSLAAGGPIQFTLSIPAASGRTIKEITKIVGGATGITVNTLNTATAATLYTTTPIAGTGTTAVFTTTIADFKKKYPTVVTTPIALPNYTEIQFLFLVTLDDGTQLVPEPVRVRIVT